MAVGVRKGAVLTFLFILSSLGRCDDLPCRARDVGIEGRSIVCVCDANYCDTITREDPEASSYVVYTSTFDGKRFEKSYGKLETVQEPMTAPTVTDPVTTETITTAATTDTDEGTTESVPEGPEAPETIDTENAQEDSGDLDDEIETTIWNRVVFRIYTNIRSQFIEGFGGSVTDAASLNWRKLSDEAQTNFIETYFGKEGIEYNLIRVPIAGSDFSTHPYTYNEEPWYDAELSNYTMSPEDLFYKLPMIKRSQLAATDEVKITASTWSPPIWMKTNEKITGLGQLRPEYYQSFADYHLRFFQEYEKAEVKIWAITTTNEPINGIVPEIVDFNSLGWLPSNMAEWIVNNLGPTIRNSKYNSTLILGGDDQRYLLHFWILGMQRANPEALKYLDGIAIHYYGNFYPASTLTNLHNRFPDKILLSTEACEGPMPWDAMKVEIGSWRRAQNYVKSILEDLNNHVVGWIDWNLCLDPEGGPNWAENFVDAPILVYGDQDEFIKQPMFYAMGHFSKFIPRGSRKIRSARRSLTKVGNVAVLKPNGNIVMVLHNRETSERFVKINLPYNKYLEMTMEPQSIKTVEINPS